MSKKEINKDELSTEEKVEEVTTEEVVAEEVETPTEEVVAEEVETPTEEVETPTEEVETEEVAEDAVAEEEVKEEEGEDATKEEESDKEEEVTTEEVETSEGEGEDEVVVEVELAEKSLLKSLVEKIESLENEVKTLKSSKPAYKTVEVKKGDDGEDDVEKTFKGSEINKNVKTGLSWFDSEKEYTFKEAHEVVEKRDAFKAHKHARVALRGLFGQA